MSGETRAAAARVHDYRQTGVPCAPGCLLLAGPASVAARAVKYRVDAADLARLIAVTAGACMVCRGCHASVVDHCHDTGRVRGLVCRWCNNRLAHLEGAYRGRPAAYPRAMGCQCIAGDPGDRVRLEAATYAYLDHAAGLGAGLRMVTARQALALLAGEPYPDWAADTR